MRPLIISIIGARPQFIKAAVVSKAFREYDNLREVLVHTGQHYDYNMSDVFFKELKIPQVKYNLGIGGGLHGQNTGRTIEKIEEVLLIEKPEGVLVYGDTDSTLAGAIAAAKLDIPVFHIEAGLRSYNRLMPEEINRVLTDHASDFLFTPGNNATEILLKEGIDKRKIHQVGDVMYDLFMISNNKLFAQKNKTFNKLMPNEEYLLLTLHRKENVDVRSKLKTLFSSLGKIHFHIIWPIHPRTKKNIGEFNLHIPDNITIIDPVGYFEMLELQRNAKIILTDSGGVQKEAYFNKKPCITLREETEWVELVDAGVNKITGMKEKKIISAINAFVNFKYPTNITNLYGHGKASEKIAKVIIKALNAG